MTLRAAILRGACAASLDTLGRQWNRARLLIIGYHGIRESTDPAHWLLLPVEEFRRQVDYLRRRYCVLPMDDALEGLRDDSLPERAAVITFDDGYLNNRRLAHPILRQAGLPWTVYLTTGLLGTDRLLWTTAVELAARRIRLPRETLLRAWPTDYPLPSRGTQADTAAWCKEALKGLPPSERADLIDRLSLSIDAETATRHGEFRMMGVEDVQALATDGVTFGGHTVHHPVLSALDDTSLSDEIGDSVQAVRRMTPSVTATFAYPNGTWADFDDRCQAVLRRLGIRAAVTTEDGPNTFATNPYCLRRVIVGGQSSFEEFRLRVSGVWRALSAARHWRRSAS